MANKVKIPRTPASTPKPEVVEESPSVMAKRVLLSKTIWVNLIMFLAFIAQKQYGFVISEDVQMQLLTLINIALRFVTKEPIVWGGEKNGTDSETTKSDL